MGTDKRQRQKAARRARLHAEAAEERKRRTVRRVVTTGGLVVVGVVLLFTLTGGGDGDDESLVETEDCAPAAGADERRTEFTAVPRMCIAPDDADYRATIETSMGTFVADLYDDRAPGTVNSFVNLARWKYFEGILFHRVIESFVVQGGDPTGTGTGGPGYELADELPETVDAYVPGSLAMANSGPDTGGSQFFVYLGPNPLPGPSYALFGQVTEATLDVPLEISKVETDPDGRPLEEVVIQSVTIEELPDGEIDDDDAFPSPDAEGVSPTSTRGE